MCKELDRPINVLIRIELDEKDKIDKYISPKEKINDSVYCLICVNKRKKD